MLNTLLVCRVKVAVTYGHQDYLLNCEFPDFLLSGPFIDDISVEFGCEAISITLKADNIGLVSVVRKCCGLSFSYVFQVGRRGIPLHWQIITRGCSIEVRFQRMGYIGYVDDIVRVELRVLRERCGGKAVRGQWMFKLLCERTGLSEQEHHALTSATAKSTLLRLHEAPVALGSQCAFSAIGYGLVVYKLWHRRPRESSTPRFGRPRNVTFTTCHRSHLIRCR